MVTELNYRELVDAYYDNLNNNLRNFRGGPGFLEPWVHDEDHNRSLLEILDLAKSSGVQNLAIQLTPTISSSLNLDWLKHQARTYGSVELQGEKLLFNTEMAGAAEDEFFGISSHYVKALKARLQNLKFEGTLSAVASQPVTVSVEDGAAQLALAMDDNGLVTQARHTGFVGPYRALFDAFCEVLTRRTIQEGAEHGVIRLEAALRDETLPRQVKGLLSPEIADSMFERPLHLIRQAFASYVVKAEVKVGRNFWRDPIPADWLALSPEEKIVHAQRRVLEGCKELGLQQDVQVVEIKNDTRFVLSYIQNKEMPDFGRHMIKLERGLRKKLSFEVELQLESIDDRNKRVERTKRV